MAVLKERLRADLTSAMKARDTLRAGVLRMVLASLSNAEVAGKQARELSDEDVIEVLTSERKKRRESADAFDAGNRPELAQKERDEAGIIAEYLPEQISPDELASIVSEAVESSGSSGAGMRAMGTVMGIVQPKVKGRADGAAVAAEVKRQLGA